MPSSTSKRLHAFPKEYHRLRTEHLIHTQACRRNFRFKALLFTKKCAILTCKFSARVSKGLFLFLQFSLVLYLCVYIFVRMSEDNLQEFLLSYHVGPRGLAAEPSCLPLLYGTVLIAITPFNVTRGTLITLKQL